MSNLRPASARPSSTHVSFANGVAYSPAPTQAQSHRPASASHAAASATAHEAPIPPSPQPSRSRSPTRLIDSYRHDKPPFRPSSGHPRDATFYSSTYESSATSGLTQRERQLSPNHHRSRPMSAIVTSHNLASSASSDPPRSAAGSPIPPTPTAAPTTTTPSATPHHHHHGPIPVRHTRRTSEYATKVEIPLPKPNSDLTCDMVRQHYEPLLRQRELRYEDLCQRSRKQESRLATMQTWKIRALDQAHSESNRLDYVLGQDGIAIESQRVRTKRIVFQRILIRQFLRTFRLLRSLKLVHRHLRTMLPLLLESPNSRLSTRTRLQLSTILESWNKEPIFIAGGREMERRMSGNTSPVRRRFGFETEQSMPTSTPQLTSTNSGSGSGGGNSHAPPHRGPDEFDFYRKHPHSYSHKLLSNLFDVVPILSSCIHDNLVARRDVNLKNKSQFTLNTSLIQTLSTLDSSIEQRKKMVEQLRKDVELLETEVRQQRRSYNTKVELLETTMRSESILLRKLNAMYYQEVEEKLGTPYAIQLAMLQQGQPYMHVIGKPPTGPGGIDNNNNDHTLNHAPPPIGSLFIPPSILGTALPTPPDAIPEFVGTGRTIPGLGGLSSPPPPHPTMVGINAYSMNHNTRKVKIDKYDMLRRVDQALAASPSTANINNDDNNNEDETHEQPSSDPIDVGDRFDPDTDGDVLSPFFLMSNGSNGTMNQPPTTSSSSSNQHHRRQSSHAGVGAMRHEEYDSETEADERFATQRQHFNQSESDDNVEKTNTSNNNSSKDPPPPRRRPQSSRPAPKHPSIPTGATATASVGPDPLPPPGKPIGPLHVRTLSEIDWFSPGPGNHMPPPDAKKRSWRNSTSSTASSASGTNTGGAAAAAAAEQQHMRLTNPFVEFKQESNEEMGETTASVAVATGASPNSPNSHDHATHSDWWNNRPDSDEPSSVQPSRSHTRHRRNFSSAPSHTRSISSCSARGGGGGNGVIASSPVPGMSPEVYQRSFSSAVASLLQLGYEPNAALDFAPHLVLAGVIQAPTTPMNGAAAVDSHTHQPRHVDQLIQRRKKLKRNISTGIPSGILPSSSSSSHRPSSALVPDRPISQEMAWISGMPSGETYRFEPPSQQPSSHQRHDSYTFATDSNAARRITTRPQSAHVGSRSLFTSSSSNHNNSSKSNHSTTLIGGGHTAHAGTGSRTARMATRTIQAAANGETTQ